MRGSRRVYDTCFPLSLASTLSLLRRRVRLSREVADDVVRARGYIGPVKWVYWKTEKYFFDDKSHGRETWLQDDGVTIRAEFTYVNGKIHGEERWWHPNGVLESDHFYVDGKMHGLRRLWRENGRLRGTIMYVNGIRHGVMRFWNEEGTVVKEEHYVNGHIVKK